MQAREAGTLTHLSASFNMNAPEWGLTGTVLESLHARKTHIWEMLQQGASIYVCGGASVSVIC